eukprot:jgi/Picsp_1/1583/NSC_05061-R1_protein grip
MSTPSPLKIPPSVANAERSDLEKLLVTTLHKMKAKDRQIAELEAERDHEKNAVSSASMEGEGSGKRVEELENAIHQLENRILESEERFEGRMKAETDLLEQNLAEARKEGGEYRARLEKEMEKVSEIEMKYTAMVEGLVKEKDELVKEKGKAEEQKADVDAYLSAEKQIWLTEKRDLEKKVEEMEAKLAQAREAASDESAQEEKRALEIEKDMESVRKEMIEYKNDAERRKEELEEVRAKMEEQLKAEASRNLQGEIMTLKSELDEAKRELQEQPKMDTMKSVEFVESAYVPKEEFLKLKDELSEAKRKYGGSLKKRQSEFDQKIKAMEETLATEKAKAAQQVQHGASGSSVEVAQIRKEVESERNRFKKALAELRRRNEVLTKAREEADGRVSDLEMEVEALKSDIVSEARKTSEASESRDYYKSALEDYKSRAQALLKSKEEELRNARAGASEQYEKEIEEAKSRSLVLEAEFSKLKSQIEMSSSESNEKLHLLKQQYVAKISDLERDLKNATESAKAASRQYEHVKVRVESYEDRISSLKNQLDQARQELAEAQSTNWDAEKLKPEIANTKTALVRVEKERNSLLEMKKVMEGEITDLQGTVKQLRRSLSLRASLPLPVNTSHDHDQTHTYDSGTDDFLSPQRSRGHANNIKTENTETLNKDIALARKRISEAEQEIDDLEREVALRNTQEIALKDTVRELQRELERVKLASKTVDMEYFKNIMLKLFETGEEESLLPIVGTMLQFSPPELNRCREGLQQRRAHQNAALLEAAGEASANVTSYVSSWLGLGDPNTTK